MSRLARFPEVSVVVIGRNEGPRLERCLRSVAAMATEGFSFETLYVDSASTDGSIALAESLGVTVISLPPGRSTAARGRNAGWQQARGEFILFLDGDTLLHPRFVVDSLPDFLNPSVAVVWGHRRELHPERSIYVRAMDLDWIYPPGETTFCGGDALFRREVLVRTGGFDETLIAGEEPELCRRVRSLGLRITHPDRPMTLHDLAITRFSEYWHRARRAGYAYAEVAERSVLSGDNFWTADAKRNRVRALGLLALPAIALAGASRWWVAAGAATIFFVLAARTAWKARSKSQDRSTLALYALHSWFQQIPILVGQLGSWRNRRRGQASALVEYRRG